MTASLKCLAVERPGRKKSASTVYPCLYGPNRWRETTTMSFQCEGVRLQTSTVERRIRISQSTIRNHPFQRRCIAYTGSGTEVLETLVSCSQDDRHGCGEIHSLSRPHGPSHELGVSASSSQLWGTVSVGRGCGSLTYSESESANDVQFMVYRRVVDQNLPL